MSWTRPPDSFGGRALASAERRFAVVMAFFGVAVGLRLVSNDATYWNFPCNSPCPHTTFFARPMLDYLILSWLLYALFSFLHFSVDYFERLPHGQSVREFFGRVATVLLYLYPSFVVFVGLSAEGSYLVPSWVQAWYWFLADGAVGLMALTFASILVGRSLFKPYFTNTRATLGLVTLGMRIQGGNLHYTVVKLVARLRRVPVTAQVDPTNRRYRLEVLSIIGAQVAVTASTTWTFTNIRGWYFLGVVDIVLVGFMVLSAIIGWRSQRSDSKRKKSELRVPRHLWSRFRSRCWTRLLAWFGRSRITP